MNVPAGWAEPKLIGDGAAAGSPGSTYVMSIDVATAIDPDRPLADFAASWRDFALYPIKQKIAEDVIVAGQPWFHLTGKINGTQVADDYGTVSGGIEVTIGVESQQSIPPAERQAVLDSMLASIVLTP